MLPIHTTGRRDVIFEITGVRYLPEKKVNLLVRGKAYHVWALVVCAIYWGIFDTSWVVNIPYGGLGTQLVCLILVTCSNLIAASCLQEMISAIPSAGGILGFTRVALGPLESFLAGTVECVCLALTTALGSLFWANYMKDIFQADVSLLVVFSLLIYIGSAGVIIVGGRFMWDFMLVCGIVTSIIILLFLISGMKNGDFNANAFQYAVPTSDSSPMPRTDSQEWFKGGLPAFYMMFPDTFWFYGGVECTGVIGEEVENVKLFLFSISGLCHHVHHP